MVDLPFAEYKWRRSGWAGRQRGGGGERLKGAEEEETAVRMENIIIMSKNEKEQQSMVDLISLIQTKGVLELGS